MFERFTDAARRAVVVATEEGRRLGHDYIGTEHVLLALVQDTEGVAGQALAEKGVELDPARRAVEDLVGRGDGAPAGHIPFTPRAKEMLELSLREALALGHRDIGTEHLLLGLLQEDEGVGCQALVALGVAPESLEARVRSRLGTPDPATGAKAGGRRRFRRLRQLGQTVVDQPTPFLRVTPGARRVVLLAESEALRLGRSRVGEEHVLLGVAAEGEGRGARALAAVGVTLDAARAHVEPSPDAGTAGEAPLSPVAQEVMKLALAEALDGGRQQIDTEDILLGLVHRAEDGQGAMPALFAALGTTADALRAAVAGLSEG